MKNIFNFNLLIFAVFFVFFRYEKCAGYNIKKDKIFLNIHLVDANVKDTLTIFIGDNMLSTMSGAGDGDTRRKFKSVKNKEGLFKFEIPVSQSSGYFSISKNRLLAQADHSTFIYVTEPQFWEIGDSLNVRMIFKESPIGSDADCTFSGIGSLKYNLANKFLHFKVDDKSIFADEIWPVEWNGNILEYDKFDRISPLTKTKLDLLESFKSKLTPESYSVLKANLIYGWKSGWFSKISSFVKNGGFNKLTADSQLMFIKRFESSYDFPKNYNIDEKFLAKSLSFLYFLVKKNQTSAQLHLGKYSPELIYEIAKNLNVSDEIKEIIIMRELLHSWVFAENLEYYYTDAKSVVKSNAYLKLLKDLESRIPGKQFTNFKLQDLNGRIKSLKNYKNKILLIDFWFSGCGHCQDYYRDVLSKAKMHFSGNQNVVFLSVSIDKNKSIWRNSVKGGTYNEPNGENLYTNGLGDQHPIIRLNNIPGYPCVILLNKNSQIKFFNTINLYDEKGLTEAIKGLL